MTKTEGTRTAAIGASDLTAGMAILGDHICRTRYGSGATVNVVNTEGDRTYAIIAGRRVEFVAAHTVYVKR